MSKSGSKKPGGRPRVRRARPLLVAAGAVFVVSGCHGTAHGAAVNPCATTSECADLPPGPVDMHVPPFSGTSPMPVQLDMQGPLTDGMSPPKD